SRRRHTRSTRDWSSDVCSSDLTVDGALVFRASVDPQRRLEDRAWRPASIDLAAHAGQRVTLAFAIAAASAPPRPDDLAGWAEPRLSASGGTPPPTAAPAPSR